MEVKLRFPLKRKFILEDHWPLAGQGAVLTFETVNGEATAIIVSFKNQPPEAAPQIQRVQHGKIKANITIRGRLEARGRKIVERFVDFTNLYLSLEVDLDGVEAEYIPASDEERRRMGLYSFKTNRQRPTVQMPFDLLAQAFFAGESSDDPSFASRMFHLAREALISEQYIDSFRYSFLLIEAFYGDGKFKTAQLVGALLSGDFKRMLHEASAELLTDPINAKSAARPLAIEYKTPDALANLLVTKRGFYFHGNLARANTWHPDRQAEARPLAELGVLLGSKITHTLGGAMFGPNINSRFIENAKAFGAVMPIEVQVDFIDRNGVQGRRGIRFECPGTVATTSLAIRVNQHFLKWAEAELADVKIISAVGRDTASGQELFRTRFLEMPSEPPPNEE